MSYIERETALQIINNYAKTVSEDGKVVVDAIRDIVEMITPAADVVAVVRCRDCKHFVDEDETDMLGLCTCKRIAIAYNGEIYPERDFYCPYGERIEK